MPVLSELEFEQLLADYEQWKIAKLPATIEYNAKIAQIIDVYDQGQNLIILSPIPNNQWRQNPRLNPFILEKNFRQKHQLNPITFFVVNNYGNLHWDCYRKDPNQKREYFESSGEGNSCAAYTLLNIISQIPNIAHGLIVEEAMQSSQIDNLVDVNALSSEQVRDFLLYIFENHVKPNFGINDEIFNQLIKDIKTEGDFLSSDHLRYGLLAVGVNYLEAIDLEEQHADILSNIRNNLLGAAETDPEKYKQEELEELGQYLQEKKSTIKIEDVIQYLEQFSLPKAKTSHLVVEASQSSFKFKPKPFSYLLKTYGFLGNNNNADLGNDIAGNLSDFIVVDPAGTAFSGMKQDSLLGSGASGALYQLIGDQLRPTYNNPYNRITEEYQSDNSKEQVCLLKAGEAIWNDVYQNQSKKEEKPFGVIHAVGPNASIGEQKTNFEQLLTTALAGVFLQYHYATQDLTINKPGLRIPLISGSIFRGDISDVDYYRYFNKALKAGYNEALKELKLNEIDFGKKGLEICCYGSKVKEVFLNQVELAKKEEKKDGGANVFLSPDLRLDLGLEPEPRTGPEPKPQPRETRFEASSSSVKSTPRASIGLTKIPLITRDLFFLEPALRTKVPAPTLPKPKEISGDFKKKDPAKTEAKLDKVTVTDNKKPKPITEGVELKEDIAVEETIAAKKSEDIKKEDLDPAKTEAKLDKVRITDDTKPTATGIKTTLAGGNESSDQYRKEFNLPKPDFKNNNHIITFSRNKFELYKQYSPRDSSQLMKFMGFFKISGEPDCKMVIRKGDQFLEINIDEKGATGIVNAVVKETGGFISKIKDIKVERVRGTNDYYNLVLGNVVLTKFNLKQQSKNLSGARPSDFIGKS